MARSKQKAQLRWDHWRELVQTTSDQDTDLLAERAARIAKAKSSYKFFAMSYFPQYATAETPDFHVDLANKVKRNRTIKAIVRWGRAQAKSIVCDFIIPLWLWINGEDIYLVLIGNTQDKAIKLLADLKSEFESNELLRADFGDQTTNTWRDDYFVCRERFVAAALGMGQEVRGLRRGGRRPNFCICDDLEDKNTVKNPKIQDEVVTWILGSLLPTMDGPTRRALFPNNNFAPRTIQSELEKRNPYWLVHRVDATVGPSLTPRWASKYPADHFIKIREEIGSVAFEAEYNNRPWIEGKIFTQEMIDRCWCEVPTLKRYQHIIGHWDPAYSGKNDYNAVKVWGLHDHRFYLLGGLVDQCTMRRAVDWIQRYDIEARQKGVIIHWRVESQFWNEPLRQAIADSNKQFHRQLNISVVDTPRTKKLDRLMAMCPYYEIGKIRYDEQLKNDVDILEGVRQLMGIEPGYRTHDDSPDADERAVAALAAFDRAFSFSPQIAQATNSRNTNY